MRVKLAPVPMKSRWLALCSLALFAMLLTVACGTDFPEPPAASASEPTPLAVPTVFRVIEVTPAPTSTPVPLDEGDFYDRASQRPFPPEIDGSGTKTPLPGDAVLALWENYLSDAHVVIPDREVDLHLCADGRIVPGEQADVVERGAWGLRLTEGDWFEAMLGREFGRRRLAAIATLSRNGGRTVVRGGGFALVSVTDSDRCGD